MIQDIAPMKLDNVYKRKTPHAGSRMLGFGDRTVFLEYNGEVQFLTYEQWKNYNETVLGREVPPCVYLFSVGEEEYFLTDIGEDTKMGEFCFYKMFDVRAMQPKECVLVAATAWHLYVWYRDNQFCGRCGERLVHSDVQRMMQCPCCKNMVFPKIAPAVIVGVTNGDQILMTKYAGREYKRYALIAGFTEIGETAEETVKREVMEEVGLNVKNIRYYKSQPWGFDSNLLLGYFCELADERKIRLDEEELSVAEWVDYHDIPEDKEKLSLTHEMMTYFGKKKSEGTWDSAFAGLSGTQKNG